jgi:hypothetical protein
MLSPPAKPHETHRLSDTTPEAQRVLDASYNRMSMAARWKLVWQLHEQSRSLFAAGVRMRNATATDAEIADLWLRETLDPQVYSEVCEHVQRTT